MGSCGRTTAVFLKEMKAVFLVLVHQWQWQGGRIGKDPNRNLDLELAMAVSKVKFASAWRLRSSKPALWRTVEGSSVLSCCSFSVSWCHPIEVEHLTPTPWTNFLINAAVFFFAGLLPSFLFFIDLALQELTGVKAFLQKAKTLLEQNNFHVTKEDSTPEELLLASRYKLLLKALGLNEDGSDRLLGFLIWLELRHPVI